MGKTALVVDIILAFPEAEWTAVKISPHGHEARAESGDDARAGSLAAEIVLEEDKNRSGLTDTSRFGLAGAKRTFWLRTPPRQIAAGMERIEKLLEEGAKVIVESNAVLEILQPQLYLMVLDPSVREFKESARRWLGRVDAFVTRGPRGGAGWERVSGQIGGSKPVYEQRLGEPLPEGLLLLIRNRLFASVHPPTT